MSQRFPLPELKDLPEDLPFWKEIAASTENCIGSECPQFGECFVTRMRQRAADDLKRWTEVIRTAGIRAE